MTNMLKYPVGVQSFEVLREDGFMYVDKTALIYKLAQQHICFLCRPRRFGNADSDTSVHGFHPFRRAGVVSPFKVRSREKAKLNHPTENF